LAFGQGLVHGRSAHPASDDVYVSLVNQKLIDIDDEIGRLAAVTYFEMSVDQDQMKPLS
jgi:hypothetical protein